MPTINDCMTLERSGGSKYSEHRSGASNEWKEGDVQEPSRVNGKHAGEKSVDGGNVKSPGIHENMERSKPRHNGAVASNGRIHDDEIASGRQEEVTSGFSDGKWAEKFTNGRHREMPGEFEELVMPEAGHENGHQQLDFKEIIKEVLEEYEDSPDSILQFKNTLLKRLERLVPRKKPQSRFFKMDSSEFRKRGKEMVDYIADYMETLSVRRVTSQVEPGYLKELIPSKAPWKGDDWDKIMEDVERVIMPGITHWQHPHFHAYFPAGNSYPSILGDMLSDAIGCVGFSWAASPACTELETIVLDWVGKMIGLPKQFLHEEDIGGGVIQSSASECVLITMLAARHAAITDLKRSFPFVEDGKLLSKLVGYSSKLAHSCVEKAGMIGLVKMRELEVDSNYSLRGYVLEAAIEEDRRLGLIPFYVSATLGTTAVCSFDNLAELAEVCSNEKVWLHVDGAYAGSALICPEYQHLLKGIEYANSINLNPNKWMLVNFDCSLLWVKDSDALTRALTVDPVYLQHPHGDRSIDFRHWGIPLSRRFRALKLWFVIRTYGVDGLQQYIREHVRLSKLFEAQVLTDDRFETIGEVTMGLVCFRLKGPNTLTQKLLRLINDDGRLHVVPALVNEHYVIRFAICAQNAEDDDITYAWSVITEHAEDLFSATRRNSSRESIKLDSDTTTEDEEEVFLDFDKEIIYDNQRSNFQRARMRRNLFLRMVSDPKSYNPRLWKSLCLDNRDRSLGESPAEEKESASSYPASVAHSNGGLMH